jgi:hypothetical protein
VFDIETRSLLAAHDAALRLYDYSYGALRRTAASSRSYLVVNARDAMPRGGALTM